MMLASNRGALGAGSMEVMVKSHFNFTGGVAPK